MSAIIEFNNISKIYNNKKIIHDFNLKIEKGEFLTVIGSSGSGKTTLLKMINGLIIPEEGKIFVDKKDIKKENLIQLRRNIGYSIQGSVLFPHMTIEDNISYVLNLSGKKNKKANKQAVSKWMKIVGLSDDLRNRYPSELSGGQQQRVGIARALVASPNILLMDEPFGAVDEITRAQLQKELKEIHTKTGVTIIFITHDISEALKLGTKVLVLNEGAVQQYDTPKNIIDNPKNKFVKQLLNMDSIKLK